MYRYGKLVREYNTELLLSKRLGQKIFPKWNIPADYYNGNSRTTLKILRAYVIITPNAPCRLNTDPYVQPACTAKPPPANNKAQTPQKPPNLDCTSQAPSPRMAAAMASGDQTQTQTATTVIDTNAGQQHNPATNATTNNGTANNGATTGIQNVNYLHY